MEKLAFKIGFYPVGSSGQGHMESDHRTPSGGGVKINRTPEVFDTGDDVPQTDPFKFLLVGRVKSFSIVFDGATDPVFIPDQRNIKCAGSRMFDGIVYTFLYYPVKNGLHIAVQFFVKPFGVNMHLQFLITEFIYKIMDGSGQVIFEQGIGHHDM